MIFDSINEVARAFWKGFKCVSKPRKECIKEDKEMRDNLSERQIDKAIEGSFPASDPSTIY